MARLTDSIAWLISIDCWYRCACRCSKSYLETLDDWLVDASVDDDGEGDDDGSDFLRLEQYLMTKRGTEKSVRRYRHSAMQT